MKTKEELIKLIDEMSDKEFLELMRKIMQDE